MEEQKQTNQDRLALAVSIIFLVAVVLLGIRIFNTGLQYNFSLSERVATVRENITNRFGSNNDENIIASSTQRDIDISDGDINPSIITSDESDLVVSFFPESSTNEEKIAPKNSTNDSQDLALETAEEVSETSEQTEQVTETDEQKTINYLNPTPSENTQTSTWKANDYKKGDIQAGSYQVRSGDTLWEIAEAVYGNGADWVNILNANSGSIGFQANGQQSMIYAGQTLNIPGV